MRRDTALSDMCLRGLSAVAGHHGVHISEDALQQAAGMLPGELTVGRLVRLAKEAGLEARSLTLGWRKLLRLGQAFPAIALLKDGGCAILSGVRQSEDGAPQLMAFDLNGVRGGGFHPLDRKSFEQAYSGRTMLLRLAGAEGEEKRFSLSWFLPQMRLEKGLLWQVALIALFLHGLAFAVPLYFQAVVDKVLTNHAVTTLQALGAGVVVALLFEGALRFFRQYLLRFATTRMDMRLAQETFWKMVRLPLRFFEQSFAGVVVKHMQQADQIREFLTGNLLSALLDASALVVFLPVLYLYSPKLTLVVLAFSVGAALVVALLIRPFHNRLMRLYEAEGARQALLVETIQGMPTVKSLALERSRRARWEEASARAVTANFSVEKTAALAQSVIRTLERLMSVAVIWLGVSSVFDGVLTVGALIAFQMLSQNVASPLIRLVEMAHEFQRVRISVSMLGEIMNRTPERSLGRDDDGRRLHGRIAFKDVRFAYGPHLPAVLDGVSFEVEPGKVLGVVGRSGSGKTTITRLLQGLLQAGAGEVLLDGVDVRRMDPTQLRRQIGVVLQENFIFHGSVRENISLSRPAAKMSEVVRAAEMAGADEFIRLLPDGYDTMLEENGSNLSGGQKQRLAIARALMNDPRILVFDEATSNLDPESEAAIQANLAEIAKGRTTIIVAHRLSTLRRADEILVLDKGRVREMGRHEDLVEGATLYGALWRAQQGEAA